GDETADRLVETMLPKIAQLKVGPGTDKGLDMGPLVTAEHRDKVLGFIEDGVNRLGLAIAVTLAVSSLLAGLVAAPLLALSWN
ncbi:aldehyde dehydrogenase family protein, partial [Pseudoalteromonas sp. SIMBA_153]